MRQPAGRAAAGNKTCPDAPALGHLITRLCGSANTGPASSVLQLDVSAYTAQQQVLAWTLPAGNFCAQVAALPWRDVCGLWKDYTTATADCLAAAAGDDGGAAGRRLTRLLFEAGQCCHESDDSPALVSRRIPAE